MDSKLARHKKTPPKRVVRTDAITCCGYQRLRFQRDGSWRGQQQSCCLRLVASRPCLRCRRGLLQCPWKQVGLDSFSATDRQALVVSVGADGVGMTNSDDDFQVHAFQLGGQVVQLGLAVRLQNGFVKVEEGVCSESDFLGGRSRSGAGAGAGAGATGAGAGA